MALIKEEADAEQSCSDTWLHNWVNPKQEIKEEDEKPSLHKIKYECKDEDVNQQNFENNKNKLALSVKSKRKLTKRKGDQIINAQSKKSRKRNVPQDTNDTNMFVGPVNKKAFEKAPVSDILANLCEYQCPQCYKKIGSRASLYRHFKEANHGRSKHGRVIRYQYMVKIVVHKCYVCFKKVLCDTEAVKSHIKVCHGIVSIKKYCDKYGAILKTSIGQAQNENNYITELKRNKSAVTDFVGNLCSFKCLKCEYSCHSWRLMTKHVNTKLHGLLLQPSAYFSNITLHKCQLCQEKILCDNQIIKNHLATKHKKTVRDYNSHFPPNETLNTRYVNELRANIQDIPTVKPQSKYFLNPNSIPENYLTGSVGNITLFKCPLCPKANISYSQLRGHCKRSHQHKHLPYSTNLVIEARYHKCHICSSQVLCDNHILTRHLFDRHKIRMPMYIKNYVLKRYNKVFPTFSDYSSNVHIFKETNTKHANVSPQDKSSNNSLILPGMISSESEDSDE